MSTKNIVPRANNEGSVGTASKNWGSIYTHSLYIDGQRLGAGGSTASNDIGAIVAFMALTAPIGYLACDGSIYNISDYTALATFFENQFGASNHFGGDGTLTFAVPDLRGEFLRGAGTISRSGQGSGSSVGTHQDSTKHIWIQRVNEGSYYITTSSVNLNEKASSHNCYPKNYDHCDSWVSGNTWCTCGGSNSSTRPQYYTSRPTNTSVLYCIKYI